MKKCLFCGTEQSFLNTTCETCGGNQFERYVPYSPRLSSEAARSIADMGIKPAPGWKPKVHRVDDEDGVVKASNKTDGAKCGCYMFLLVVNFIVGGFATNFLLNTFYSKTIPFIWASLIGLVGGELIIPVALIVAVLRTFNIL